VVQLLSCERSLAVLPPAAALKHRSEDAERLSVVRGAGPAYGTFAAVIGLLTWPFLGARVVVYSAELSSVLAGGVWPRTLLDDGASPSEGRTMFRAPRARESDQY